MAASRVIIAGGTGFVGRNLGGLLLSTGYNVTVISRTPGLNTISWDQVQKVGIPAAKAVVNCCGQNLMDFKKSWTPNFKQELVNSRVNTTETLAHIINNSVEMPEVFILLTGVGAYEPDAEAIYDEDSCPQGRDFFSKLVMDVEAAAQLNPAVRYVSIRSGAVLGRGGGMIQSMYLPFLLGVGGPIGSGKQFLPWIHIEDLTRLIKFVIENNDVSGVLNAVAPQVITNKEFSKAFGRALNRPAILPVPEFLLNFVLHEERASIMTKGQHVIPRRVLEYGFKFRYPNIDDACKELAGH